jgi:diaminopimelate epimerase
VIPTGRRFFKMSGSGNDFVFVDARLEPAGDLATPAFIEAVCARGTGVGADGIVFLLPSTSGAAVRMRYLNSDGSLAALCGNATLCTARLALELGQVGSGDFVIETDSGPVVARVADGLPEIDLQPPRDVDECVDIPLTSGERRIGYALVGVPHLVVLCEDVDEADVIGRGRSLRHHPGLAQGANVNFVSGSATTGWRVRTYERGVEAETLACGTGAVATGILLGLWGEDGNDLALQTRSGRSLRVRLPEGRDPSLSGDAQIVFLGTLAEIPTLGRKKG